MKLILASIFISALLLLNGCSDKSPTDAPKMTVQEKKERFKKLLLPAVTEAYNDLNRRYLEVAQELEQGGQNGRISQLK